MQESTWCRAYKDTVSAQRTLRFMWVGEGVLAVAGGTWLSQIASSSASTLEIVARSVLGGLIGLASAALLIFGWYLFRAPYKQRNEATKQVEQLTNLAINSKYYEQNAEKALSKHWDDLVILCQSIASKISLPFSIDERYFGLSSEVDKEDDGIKAIMFISHWENMDAHNAKMIDWGLYPYLHVHLKAEDQEWEASMLKLKTSATTLHNKLYALSLVAMRITHKWHIILIHDWANIDGTINAGEYTPALIEALKPINEDVMQAYYECEEAMLPIQQKLHDMAKKRTFKGKCPACS